MKYVKTFCILVLIVCVLIGVSLYKPPLKNATVGELDAIYGICADGVILSKIENYIIENPNATVEDLRIIKGVDDMIIDQLKERFR